MISLRYVCKFPVKVDRICIVMGNKKRSGLVISIIADGMVCSILWLCSASMMEKLVYIAERLMLNNDGKLAKRVL